MTITVSTFPSLERMGTELTSLATLLLSGARMTGSSACTVSAIPSARTRANSPGRPPVCRRDGRVNVSGNCSGD